MMRHEYFGIKDLGTSLSKAALTLMIMFMLTVAASQAARAQYKVIHNFTGGQDGASPYAGVTIDTGGNLYGTATVGGIGYGTVYQLKRKSGGFVFNPILSFDNGDGYYPRARVVFGPNNLLYGTTADGGAEGVGVVFKLAPSPRACTTSLCPWVETVLYSFTGGADGEYPGFGDLAFDQEGDIYGTTRAGGNGAGVVYELTPPNNWGTENTLYAFSGSDGEYPFNGVIFDNQGNLYGTTDEGGRYSFDGTVFQLSSVTGESLLHSFSNGSDGSNPIAGLVFDPSFSNLYGASSYGGSGGGGVVFELSTSGTFNSLYSFTGSESSGCPTLPFGYGPGPWASLTMDANRNLYGTTVCDGANGFGNIFQLVYSSGNYTYKDLYDFTGGNDGAYPISNVVFDTSGNLYGTASGGGSQGAGVVWELTP